MPVNTLAVNKLMFFRHRLNWAIHGHLPVCTPTGPSCSVWLASIRVDAVGNQPFELGDLFRRHSDGILKGEVHCNDKRVSKTTDQIRM